jgi:predicted transcriptional regulator
MANLTEIARKFRISDHFLNSKEDGLLVVASSLQDIIGEMNSGQIDRNKKESLIEKLERLSVFCKEVKNAGF